MAVYNVFLFIFYFLIDSYPTNAKPVVDIDSKSYAFLRDKGYIDSTTIGKGVSQLQNEQGIIDALRRFQGFAGIPKTGRLDDLTKEYMVKPRCGMSDMTNGRPKKRVKRYNRQGSYWKDTRLTWALENSNNDGITDMQVRRLLTLGFYKWSSVTNLHFTELYKQPENTAKIRVRFERWRHGDPYPFDGYGGTLAHAFYPLNNKGLAGDVHFDDDEVYTIKTKAKKHEKKLLWVIVHELGHSIGLEHSPTKGAIMWPYYQNFDTPDFDLTYDDIIGIQSIYGGKIRTTSRTRHPLTLATRAPTVTSLITAPRSTAPRSTAPVPTSKPEPRCIDQMKSAFLGANRKLYFVDNDKLFMLYDQTKIGIEKGPVPINTFFRKVTGNKIDAVFKHPYYRTHYVFHGDKFSVYNCWRDYCLIRRDGRPRKINDGFQNIKEKLENIDAAFIWPGTRSLYIFKGEQFWVLSRKNYDYIAEHGYPQNIAAKFHGLPKTIDTAFQWTNDKIYFTKDKLYYRWDDRKQTVHSGYPIELTRSFLNCKAKKG